LKIFFFCVTPAEQGGATPLGDMRKLFQIIPPDIRERFREKQYMYVRNFGDGFGLSWQTAFQTSDKQAVEQYCQQHKIECEWKAGDRLRTRQIRPAVIQHPQTGEDVWFNHLTFFHISTLPAHIREPLLASFAENDLPNNTYYGDGSPIEETVLAELRHAYQHVTVAFPWQKGDLLMLDNVLTSHGREPFVGRRKVVVGMSEPFTRSDI
jgi:alpha-ketoglutarate-dependent taurine dioxygenase